MRNFITPYLNLIVMSIFLSGCIVKSSQLNGLLDLIREPRMDLSNNSWIVRYTDYESIVYAISTSEGILFANNFGDQVLFDGWTLLKAQGMGRRQININISDKKNIRTFERGDKAISKHHCNQWEQQKNSGAVRYTQSCSDKKRYENSILVKENGEISMIRQIVDESYTALTLTKLK